MVAPIEIHNAPRIEVAALALPEPVDDSTVACFALLLTIIKILLFILVCFFFFVNQVPAGVLAPPLVGATAVRVPDHLIGLGCMLCYSSNSSRLRERNDANSRREI